MAKPFESKIQDLVYNVDAGIGLRLIKFGLYALFVLVLMLLYTVTQFKGLREAGAMEYAQLGRNLLQQRAFVTQCVRPASMWHLVEKTSDHHPRIDRHPDILHPPLYPLLLAGGFQVTRVPLSVHGGGGRIYQPEQWVVVPLGHLFTLLTALMLYLLGRRLFDARVAFLSVTMYFLSRTVWHESIAGMGLPILSFLALLAFYLSLVAAQNQRAGSSLTRWFLPLLFSSAACAAAFMTRYGAVVLTPAVTLYLALSLRGRARWLGVAAFLAVFAAASTPWLVRNVMVSGAPLGLAPYGALENSRLFEGDLMMRTLAPSFQPVEVIRALQHKWMTNVASFYTNHLRLVGDGFLISLFMVTFLHRFARQRVHLLRWALAVGLVLLILTAGFFGEQTIRLLFMFWPLVLLYGMAYFFILLDRLELRYRILSIGATVVFMGLCALPLLFALLPPRAGIPYPPYYRPWITHVSTQLEPRELLCTDMPWATAWYGGRNSLLLPATLDDFYEIYDYNKRISGLYITNLTRDKPYTRTLLRGYYRTWFPILEGRIPSDFPLTHGFPLGNMDQLFLSDRPRWQQQPTVGGPR